MSKNIKIYCEGNKDSFDKQILDFILNDIIGKRPLIEPLGGKKGVGSLIKFDSAKLIKPSFYFFFRDRDFDEPVSIKDELKIIDKKDSNQKIIGKHFYSYRTTIENYLFDYKTLFNFLKKENLLQKNNIKNEDDVKNKMIEAAKIIKNYQAVRHTLGALRENLDLGTSFLSNNKSSGDLPSDLSLAHCKKEALDKIKLIKANIIKWDKFEEKLQEFLNIFEKDYFYDDMQFLVWFQGKDYSTSLSRILVEFSSKSYFDFSIKKFDYKKFPDSVQLKTIIQQKSDE